MGNRTRLASLPFGELVTLGRRSESAAIRVYSSRTVGGSPSAPVDGIATEAIKPCTAPVSDRLLGYGARLCDTRTTRTTASVTAPAAALSSAQEVPHPPCRDNRRDPDARAHHARAGRHMADHGRRTPLDTARLMASSGPLHPPARVGRLAPHRNRLARQQVAVLRRHAVPHLDVAISRRVRSAVVMVAQGAALPGLGRLASGWWELARVGHRRCLRAPLTASFFAVAARFAQILLPKARQA